MDKTFSIIKPDATKRNITGGINKIIELLLKREFCYLIIKQKTFIQFTKKNHSLMN